MAHKGLCIGGPLAGQRQASEGRSFVVEQRQPPPPLSEKLVELPPDYVAADRCYYRHTTIEKVELFILDTMSHNDTLLELAKVYENAKHGSNFEIDPATGRPVGDFGTGEQAIDWILRNAYDSTEVRTFLRYWKEGSTIVPNEWPEFFTWLAEQDAKG